MLEILKFDGRLCSKTRLIAGPSMYLKFKYPLLVDLVQLIESLPSVQKERGWIFVQGVALCT